MFEKIRNKSEDYRRKMAFGISLSLFLIMFFSWAHFKGLFGYSEPIMATKSDGVQETSQLAAVSPIASTKNIFSSFFEGVASQYNAVTESLSAVFVPFITGINVYEKTGK